MLKVEVADVEGAKQKFEEVKKEQGEDKTPESAKEALKKTELPLRPMEDVMNELMDKFLGLSKHARRELLKIIKDCPRGR